MKVFTLTEKELRDSIVNPLLIVMASYIPLDTATAIAEELVAKEIEKLRGKQQ